MMGDIVRFATFLVALACLSLLWEARSRSELCQPVAQMVFKCDPIR